MFGASSPVGAVTPATSPIWIGAKTDGSPAQATPLVSYITRLALAGTSGLVGYAARWPTGVSPTASFTGVSIPPSTLISLITERPDPRISTVHVLDTAGREVEAAKAAPVAVALRQAKVGEPVPVLIVRRGRELNLLAVPTSQPRR